MEMDEGEFLLLRAKVDELAYLLSEKPCADVGFPSITTRTADGGEAIEAGDVLAATLTAINKATATLATGGIAFAGDPIDMRLYGEFIGLNNLTGQVIVKVKPAGKGEGYGQKKK